MLNIKDQEPRDENGKRHGEWVSYHDNGNLWYRRNYFHGFLHGLSETYHRNGRLSYRGFWNIDRKVGFWCWNKEKEYYLCLV